MAVAQVAQSRERLQITDVGSVANVVDNFPSRLMYALQAVRDTTLGDEIVEVAVPFAKYLIPVASKFQKGTNKLWPLCLALIPLIVVIKFCSLIGLVNSFICGFAVAFAGMFGVMYMIILVVIYFFGIAIPLKYVIMPVALVIEVSDTGTESANVFLEISEATESARAHIDMDNQILCAAQLRQETEITFMMYEPQWVKRNVDFNRFAREVGVCAIHIVTWCYGHCDDIKGFILPWIMMFGFAICMYIAVKAAFVAGIVAWIVLNIVFCCMPTEIFDKAQQKVKDYVLERAKQNRDRPITTREVTIGAISHPNTADNAEEGPITTREVTIGAISHPNTADKAEEVLAI